MEGYSPLHKGSWRAIWCPTGKFSEITGGEIWSLYTHAVLDKYATLTTATLLGVVKTAFESEDPLGLVNATLKSMEYIPPVGTADRFAWESVLYIACTEARKFPPSPDTVFAQPCRAPTPLPSAERWRTPLVGSFTVYSTTNGRLAGVVSGTKATPDVECFCALNSVMSGTSRYCPISQSSPSQVTYCVKK